jgi:hypothetical protein
LITLEQGIFINFTKKLRKGKVNKKGKWGNAGEL